MAKVKVSTLCRHRQSELTLPPRCNSELLVTEVQQTQLFWQPLEAISCLLAQWTFISTERKMAMTLVSALKPGQRVIDFLTGLFRFLLKFLSLLYRWC